MNPHQLLNEVGRVIAPSGYIVLLGFNPFQFITDKKMGPCFSTSILAIPHLICFTYERLVKIGFEPFIVHYLDLSDLVPFILLVM